MKNVLLSLILGSASLLSASSTSNSHYHEDIRQKRDYQNQRSASQAERRHLERKNDARKRNHTQKHQREIQRHETKRTMKMREKSQRSREYQEQKRHKTDALYQKKLQSQHSKKSFQTQKQKKHINRRINQRDGMKRTFRTHQEFNRVRPHLRDNYHHSYGKRDYKRHHNIRQSELTYFINSWYFIYRDTHAPFYDQFGYFYGFFNQYGYYFEGIFYAYDRYYTYEDRLRGMGIFNNRYYAPYLEYGYNDWHDSNDDPYYH